MTEATPKSNLTEFLTKLITPKRDQDGNVTDQYERHQNTNYPTAEMLRFQLYNSIMGAKWGKDMNFFDELTTLVSASMWSHNAGETQNARMQAVIAVGQYDNPQFKNFYMDRFQPEPEPEKKRKGLL